MGRLNYRKTDGQRSCISLSAELLDAIDFICKRKHIATRNEYIASIIKEVGDTNNLSGAIRNKILLELLKMIGG